MAIFNSYVTNYQRITSYQPPILPLISKSWSPQRLQTTQRHAAVTQRCCSPAYHCGMVRIRQFFLKGTKILETSKVWQSSICLFDCRLQALGFSHRCSRLIQSIIMLPSPKRSLPGVPNVEIQLYSQLVHPTSSFLARVPIDTWLSRVHIVHDMANYRLLYLVATIYGGYICIYIKYHISLYYTLYYMIYTKKIYYI